ncbi:MAG: glycosyltransferase family 2 protein [Candidatus Brocadiaceae bacterium]|nr:glycosyltransferase family 2 protein [Candidatus Brocadiaceae bacterium]
MCSISASFYLPPTLLLILMENRSVKLSIVVPLYNEEECVKSLYHSITQVAKAIDRSYEIIFIDDGSCDNTFAFSKTIHENDPHLKVIKFRRNYGQTPAMQAGFDHANGKIIVSMDGDLQNDPKDIPKLLEKIDEGYDAVFGWRKNRKDKLFTRKIPSTTANWLIRQITGMQIHDLGCSLKAFRSEVINRTRLYSDMHRFIPVIISMAGFRYTEIVVNHHSRKFGTSKYGLSRVWKVFLDIFTIKTLLGFSSSHGVWFGILSIPFLFIGTIFAFFSVKFYLAPHNNDSFSMIFPSISVLFFFLTAFILLLGFLSDMILKTADLKLGNVKGMSSVDML